MYSATADHLNLAPPQPGRWLGPMGLALVVHGLLVAALTWGVGWQTDAPPAVFEAEIWSRLPQQAAPRAVEPPPPPPAPEPAPLPKPPAPPPAPAPSPAPPPAQRQADIATAQAKKKAEDERKAREEAARKLAAEKQAAEKKAAEKKAAEKVAAEKAAAEKAAAEKARQQQLAAQAKKAAEEKRAEALAAQQREEQLRRIMGQAGASGGANATGSAQQSSGPSPGYAGRVAARIKPNVVFTEMAPGNPRAEVEVRTLPDGTITSTKLVKSSGNAAWDDAVLRAIERTASLPRDTNGKVPTALIIGLRPQD